LFWNNLAHADIWGYVDERGTAHFAAEQVDARYTLFFRGEGEFDSRKGLPVPAAAPAAVAGPLTGAASRLAALIDGSPAYRQHSAVLREASSLHGVDYALLRALVAAESGFDPQAVSPKGAVGLMQLMPDTARRYGVRDDKRATVEKKLTDPRTNTQAGTRYLRYLLDLFPGQLELAIAAYNAGEGAVQRAGNRIPLYKETQNYVRTVMQLYAALRPATPAPAATAAPSRVRMELPGAPEAALAGGAVGRGNMPTPPVPLSSH
jgi:soluble lytic murein transglycosylase-like protein